MIGPLVSIIIPAYNHEKYITYTLDSITNDNYSNKEIVVINDGSTDRTHDVINEWIRLNGNAIPITYKSRANKGVCPTMNELLGLSKGKYVLIIASDDLLYGNTITQRVDLLEKNEKNGKWVVLSDALVIDENNNITGQSSMQMNKGDKQKFKTDRGILKEMITWPSTVGPVALTNRLIYDKIGYYPEDSMVEDWFFYQRAASLNAILFWDYPVSLYRVHSSNMSGSNISNAKRLSMLNSVKMSVCRNIRWFPGFYFKFLGIKKFFQVGWEIIKLKLKMIVLK